MSDREPAPASLWFLAAQLPGAYSSQLFKYRRKPSLMTSLLEQAQELLNKQHLTIGDVKELERT